ncbi:hypothetical protein MNBD_GAMMA06-1383 [hydrothermal vent metagenome]|uniref:Nucleoprotein/polynucleotide-associated enzyme n=1 Tax=hydrothermal vent metagenome TaxID=652676 RepID=A0A3B0WV29_9ZZZZ
MSNPFQDQLLKAGVVDKKQIKKVNQEISKKKKQQRNKKETTVDAVQLKAQQDVAKKTKHDRELNRKKEEHAKNKAISFEIDQLITKNLIARDQSCELIYNFEHRKKINRIYVNDEIKQQLMQGKLGIARIEGHYELVPILVAEKIMQRNAKRVILPEPKPKSEPSTVDKDDPYADYQIPDDITW